MKDNSTNIELLTDFAIDVSESANGLSVLIKHDYYSSDNDNGRMLLNKLLDALIMASDRVFLLILTDSAVNLIQNSDKIIELMKTTNSTLICSNSADFYNIDVPEELPDNVHIASMSEITEQIIESRPNIIIE